MKTCKCSAALSILFLAIIGQGYSQGIGIKNPATVVEQGNATNYTAGTFQINFSGTSDVRLEKFSVGTKEFRPQNFPFTIVLRRNDNAAVNNGTIGDATDKERHIFFAEGTDAANIINLKTTIPVDPITSALLSSGKVNIGTDDIFANIPNEAGVVNNIERVDVLFNTPVTITSAEDIGFLVAERGGNDKFKIAAITGANAQGLPSNFGPLIMQSAWDGDPIYNCPNSEVFVQNVALTNPQRISRTGNQNVYGVYFTSGLLGITLGTTVYGFSIFPTDVNGSGAQLANWKNTSRYPITTNEAGGGGLDLVGVPFLFKETQVIFPLAINVTAFTANAQNQHAILSWSATQDANQNGFYVEHSQDNKNWKTVQFVREQPRNNYTYTHLSPGAGTHFYRLKQITAGALAEYSPVRTVEFSPAVTLNIFPNPCAGQVKIIINREGVYSIRILGINGNTVSSMEHVKGNTFNVIDLASFSKGTYVVEVKREGGGNFINYMKLQKF